MLKTGFHDFQQKWLIVPELVHYIHSDQVEIEMSTNMLKSY